MLKFPELALVCGLALLATAPAHAAGDPDKGAAVFKKCSVCHMVGDGAKNRVGPELNAVLGRTAGSLDGFKYSPSMQKAGADGLVWSAETLDAYLTAPKTYVKGNRMAFPGLPKAEDRADLIAYLETFSPKSGAAEPAPKAAEAPKVAEATPAPAQTAPAQPAPAQTAPAQPAAVESAPGAGEVLHLGRVATPDEVAAWNIDVRPDGTGLPPGHGTVAEGEALFGERCASCHGDFGEGTGRWPVLAGGQGTLKADRPEKTIGSYWPYLSTVYDYIRRAMPFGDARSLTDDEAYAITAYLLYLNDVVTDQNFELSRDNFTSIHLPNEKNFVGDTRHQEPHYAKQAEPCMHDCKADVRIIMRARILDVTPEAGKGHEGTTKVD